LRNILQSKSRHVSVFIMIIIKIGNFMKLLLPLVLMAFCLSSFAAKIKDVVVAEVNGISIYKSTLLKYHEQNLKVVRGNKKITINSSLNDLVDRIIGIQSGKENKIDQQPNIIKKMNDIVYHAQIS
jgi:hypothetical protein